MKLSACQVRLPASQLARNLGSFIDNSLNPLNQTWTQTRSSMVIKAPVFK